METPKYIAAQKAHEEGILAALKTDPRHNIRKFYTVIERGGTKIRIGLAVSKHRDKTARQYTEYALAEAAAYGSACAFWVKDGDARQAGRLARLATRWAIRVIG